MGTKEQCRQGEHTWDNQGLCWWCGKTAAEAMFEPPRISPEQAEALATAGRQLLVALGDYFCYWQVTEADLKREHPELITATKALDQILNQLPPPEP